MVALVLGHIFSCQADSIRDDDDDKSDWIIKA